jgi:hypothetical protein
MKIYELIESANEAANEKQISQAIIELGQNVLDRLVKLEPDWFRTDFDYSKLSLHPLLWFYGTTDPMSSNLKEKVKTVIRQEVKKLPILSDIVDPSKIKFTRDDMLEIELPFKNENNRLPDSFKKFVK